jgi:hypothetical protein
MGRQYDLLKQVVMCLRLAQFYQYLPYLPCVTCGSLARHHTQVHDTTMFLAHAQ